MSEKIQQIIKEIEKAQNILNQGDELSNLEIDLIKSKLRSAYDMTLELNVSSTENFETEKVDEEINKLIDVHEQVVESQIEEKIEDIKVEIQEEINKEPEIIVPKEKQEPIIEEVVIKTPEIKAETPAKDKEIVADRFQGKQKSLNDIISKYNTQKDVASRLKDNPISNIKSAIGLNDRFLIINELFKGDAEYFNVFVDALNDQNNLDEAMAFMNQNLEWDEKQDGFKKLLELVFRRFVSTENEN